MELYDVIVVGAGPAGCAAARLLTKGGLSVLVLEQGTFPRSKPCAGWVSPWAFDLIGVSPEEYGKGRVLVPFSSLVVWDGTDVPHRVSFGSTAGYGIIRSEFDSFVSSRIGGGRIRQGVRVTAVEKRGDEIVVNGAYRGRVVVGAGGHRCPIARKIGEIRPDERFVAAVVSETRISRDSLAELSPFPDCPQIVFNDDFSGYGWYFPKGEYLNIGVGTTSGSMLKSHREAFMGRLMKRKMLPDPRRHPLDPFVGHAYKLMRVTPRRLVSDGFLLVGDAAGVAYNMSGEGIGPAIFSGAIAAETIIEARGDYSEGTLSRYVGRLYDRLGSPYRRWFLSLIGPVLASAGPLLGRVITGSAIARREMVAKRWFFRD